MSNKIVLYGNDIYFNTGLVITYSISTEVYIFVVPIIFQLALHIKRN
jgi:hypothetical protein